jgi:hypothetical protein
MEFRELTQAEQAKEYERLLNEARQGTRIDMNLLKGRLGLANDEIEKLREMNTRQAITITALHANEGELTWTVGKLQRRLAKVLASRFRLEQKLKRMAATLKAAKEFRKEEG